MKKKLWKKNLGWKAGVKNILLETGVYLIWLTLAIPVGILIMTLNPKTELSGEVLLYDALVLLLILVGGPLLLLTQRKKRKSRFSSWEALHEAIGALTERYEAIPGGLRLTYRDTHMEMLGGNSVRCTLISADGKKQQQFFSLEEAYQITVDFLHDECDLTQEIEVSDDSIQKIENGCMTYSDCFDRTHTVELADCARNFESSCGGAVTSCVGERNIEEYVYHLYTSGKPVKVIFDQKIVRAFQKHFFTGNRRDRFHRMNEVLISMGFATYDMS